MLEVELFVMVDGEGNYVIHTDETELGTQWEEQHGSPPSISKVYALKLNVPTPTPTPVVGTIADTDEPVTITIS